MTPPDDSASRAIQVATAPDGSLLYLIAHPPEATPPVRGRDLLACWEAARCLARACVWGFPRRFRFVTASGTTDLAMSDRDARCWAEAVNARTGLHTSYGLSLCLRLLALVDWLAHDVSIAGLVRMEAGEAELHPALIAAAAQQRLNSAARLGVFDALAAQAAPCQLQPLREGPVP